MTFRVRWDNGHACGELPGEYTTPEEAENAGRRWLAGMVELDPDPRAALEVYSYEVIEEGNLLPR
jgi:hypothetical protein